MSGAIDYLSTWNSLADKLHFPTRRHFYYALVRTLHQGSEATTTYSPRPPLPLELIIQILRDAECTVLSRLSRHVGGPIDEAGEMALGSIAPHILPPPGLAKTSWPLPLVIGKKIIPLKGIGVVCNAVSRTASPTWKDWFSTAPLSANDLANIHGVQLFTRSKDQGWASDFNAGSWSWFNVVLLPKYGERLDVEEHSWQSHTNGPPASPMQRRAGAIFGPNHEIWQLAQIGDRIGVRACARFGGWRNIATMALLIVQEYFIPSFIPQWGSHTPPAHC